jgi:outer membrane protein TolC
MAHFNLARVFLRRGLAAEERQHLEAAYIRRERLTDRERHQIEAAYYDNQEDYDRAEQTLRTLVGLYPDDANGRYELGLAWPPTASPSRPRNSSARRCVSIRFSVPRIRD